MSSDLREQDEGPDPAVPRRGAGRSAHSLTDDTPLNGPDIDVAARIAWLMRTARHLRGGERLRTHDQMAAATGLAKARIQRLESKERRDSDVIAAYERVLGLAPGSLVAPVEVLCRTFPALSPRDRGTRQYDEGYAKLSAMTETLLHEDVAVEGGLWLDWARVMIDRGGIGMPRSMLAPIVRRLIGELSRSAAGGYVARYEALALLRCGPYGGLVLDLARAWVDHPDVQSIGDLVSAVGEHHSEESVEWFLELLLAERDRLVVAGALGLEATAAITTEERFWWPLLPRLAALFDASEPGSTRWEWLSHLLRLVPAEAWRGHGTRLGQPLAPKPVVRDWSRGRLNAHWAECSRRVDAVAIRLDLPRPQTVLTRLIFDLAVSPHETRAVTTYMLLGGIPEVAHEVGSELAAMAASQDDATLRSRILRRLPPVLDDTAPEAVLAWVHGEDPEHRHAAMYVAGAAGIQLPAAVLDAETHRDGFPAAAVNAAGMSGHPVLGTWLSHERADVRGAARWWLRRGPRVVT